MLKVEAQGVEKRTTAHFIKELIVPLILKNTNTMHCDVLQITYELKVTCVIAGRLVDAEVSFPITLGSVPLNFGEADQLSNSSNDIGQYF